MIGIALKSLPIGHNVIKLHVYNTYIHTYVHTKVISEKERQVEIISYFLIVVGTEICVYDFVGRS